MIVTFATNEISRVNHFHDCNIYALFDCHQVVAPAITPMLRSIFTFAFVLGDLLERGK